MDGFGEKSYNNLIASVEKARETTLPRLIYGLGIANIGLANAKLICKEIGHDPGRVMDLTAEDLAAIDGIGDVIAGNYVAYFADAEHRELFEKLLKEVKLPEEQDIIYASAENTELMRIILPDWLLRNKIRKELFMK